MPRIRILIYLAVIFFVTGCTPVEQDAYRTVVGANAFLKTTIGQHPECRTGATVNSPFCNKLAQAVGAKDLLIDAVEVYCAGPSFDAGGKCQPPAKGTPAATQATAKLQAAIAAYKQAQTDLKAAQ